MGANRCDIDRTVFVRHRQLPLLDFFARDVSARLREGPRWSPQVWAHGVVKPDFMVVHRPALFLFFFPRAGRTRPQSPHFSQFPKVSRGVLRIIQFGAVADRMILFVVKTKDTIRLERLTPKSQSPSANRPPERLLHGAGSTVYCLFLCSRSLPVAGAKLDLRSRQLSMTGPSFVGGTTARPTPPGQ